MYFENVFAGFDQLAHGASNLKGWGTSGYPDPVLLIPRRYDPAAQRFEYEVNPHFGDIRPTQVFAYNPFRIVLDVSLKLSTDLYLQQLLRAIEPIHVGTAYRRRSADSLAAFYLARTSGPSQPSSTPS